jgi:hypothetical protein
MVTGSAMFQLCSAMCCEVCAAFQLFYYGYLMCHSYVGCMY